MPRPLPRHPNVEHLKKQAKDRLRELRKSSRQAKLADAQQAIAREYGFASWPKLRAHLESSDHGLGTVEPANYHFERFTPKARQALFFARYEAVHFGSVTIEPEHILLGLIRASESSKCRVFERVGLSLMGARAEVAPGTRLRELPPSTMEILFGDSTKQVLQTANQEADRLVHANVGIAHVLLGLLRQPACAAASLLAGRGVNVQAVQQDIGDLLNEEPTHT